MTSNPPESNKTEFPSKISLSQALRKAIPWALAGAVLISITYAVYQSLFRFNGAFHFSSLAYSSGVVAGVSFGVLAICRLFWLSRSLMDRAFTWIGFCATFSGLVMLLVFIVELTVESVHWFEYTPRLIEQENRAMIEGVRRNTIGKAMKKVRDEFRFELENAPTDEEKAFILKIREKVEQEELVIAEKNAKEKITEMEQSLRKDTSAWAIFVNFLSSGPSYKPQDAGIYPALLGSIWIALITVAFAVPIGVGAALYLEEYRASSWLGNIIQVNINNLAGVPSVVYGVLGAAVFVGMIFQPLSEAYPNSGIAARNLLGGGMTLGLLTLPVIIVSAQEAIRAVPSSIRQGAYALGATQWQVIRYQVLPPATPGILTGTILAISRAIGEAAPLVLFGALLLVQQNPTPMSRFTVMPMQIFGWADRPSVLVEAPLKIDHDDLSRKTASAVGMGGSFGTAAVATPLYANQVQMPDDTIQNWNMKNTALATEHSAHIASLIGMGAGSDIAPFATAASTAAVTRPKENVNIWQFNAGLTSMILLGVLLFINAIAIYLRNRAQKKIRW